ncbi:RNA polymerase sigma factor [Kitasatospora sp. NPDC051914]|uniref:RNA polymerase sigma factor n=1 Tax=Kitasatospora sp. NPDC051914 TaxID=3154945 RepID=UPI0034164A6D
MWRVHSADHHGPGVGDPAGPITSPDHPPGRDADLTDTVRAAQEGDEQAFRQLFRAVQPGLLRYLRVLVGGRPEDAEDIASEAWLQIARDLGTFSGDWDGFRGWAVTVARNRAMDHLRRMRRRPTADLPVDHLLDLAAAEDTAGSAIATVTTADALALISRLPRDQAEAVLLRVLLGLDAESAARALGKRSGSVRMAAHRGLKRLARMLEQTGGPAAGLPRQQPAEKNSARGVTPARTATLKDMR